MSDAAQISGKEYKLSVGSGAFVLEDRNAVAYREAEVPNAVVHKDNVFNIPIATQQLKMLKDIHPILYQALFLIESVRKVSSLPFYIVHHSISVILLGSSIHHQLIEFVHIIQELLQVWTALHIHLVIKRGKINLTTIAILIVEFKAIVEAGELRWRDED